MVVAAIGIAHTLPGLAQVPPGEDPAKLYESSMQSFTSGDFAAASVGLQKVIAMLGEGPQTETVFYSLGAAYFNLPDYPKAIATFRKYLAAYPKGQHVAEITLSLGKACLQEKNYADAVASFEQLENNPTYREEVLFLKASSLKESGQIDGAIAALEKLISTGVNNPSTATAAIQLASYYSEKKDTDKAISTLQLARKKIGLLDNLMRLNALAVELGDNFLANSQSTEALLCFSIVRSPAEVVKFQEKRVQNIQKQIAANQAAMLTDSSKAVALRTENNRLKDSLDTAGKLVEQARALPDFTPALYLRIARAYYLEKKIWQTIVAYEEILRRFPTAPEHESALFGATVASAEAGRVEASKNYSELYLKTYPTNPNAQTVGFLLGQSALQQNDAVAAETYFGRMLKDQPQSQFREDMLFLMGNARFGLGKFDEAEANYRDYLKEYASGNHVEEVGYRLAVGKLFAGKYEEALGLLQAYQSKYPNGTFASDVAYRISVCKYSASLYDEVIADSIAWEAKYKGDTLLGEVLAIKADALAALGKNEEATTEYIRSYKASATDEVMNYSLFAAQKLLQKKGDWPAISQLFQEFVASRPEHPTVVSALYWIGKAKAREGKIDEARTFTADTIKKFIDDPKRDAVEQLLTQLAQLCIKKTPPAATDGQATTAPAYDPQAELLRLLGPGNTLTAQARVLFAKAELARLKRKPAEEQAALQSIADQFKPEDFSAVLLAQIGDFLLGKGQIEKAAPLFNRLMSEYPKSDYLDFAYNGLGEIAYQRKDYPKALTYFTDAVDKAGAVTKLKEVTVGRAKTLLAQGKLDEAKKIFEQIAATREWRGESTAFSIYSLGEIEQQKGQLPEAVAFYQRVYVAYQRYLPWVVKSYLNSAQVFEKMGKNAEAIKTYQEMLRNEKLANFPEVATARERLKTLSPG